LTLNRIIFNVFSGRLDKSDDRLNESGSSLDNTVSNLLRYSFLILSSKRSMSIGRRDKIRDLRENFRLLIDYTVPLPVIFLDVQLKAALIYLVEDISQKQGFLH
jgi:hypothetical protein